MAIDGKKAIGFLSPKISELKNANAKHISDSMYTEVGVHGIRYWNDTLAYKDGEDWIDIKTGSNSSGIPTKNITNFTAKSGDTKIELSWNDSEDSIIDGITLAKWKGTKIIRKIGSYPADITDGTIVVDNQERDKYATDSFVDNNLVNGETYYYRVFPYSDSGTINTNEEGQELLCSPKAYVLYGVKIDTTNSNPESALTYTDMAEKFTPASGNNGSFSYGSWEDKFPFNQIKPCLYKDGAVNYYINPSDYTKKEDGSDSDITSGDNGDIMIEFPKIYWKFETIGTDLYIRYSDAKVDDGYKCLAHMRGTTEKDKCYISAYLGYSDGTKLRSLSGKTPTVNKTIGTFRTLAQANGSGYDQMAYYQLLMLQVLFTVMFKNRDSQTALGRGYVDGNSSSISTGNTNKKGLFYGETTGKMQNKFCGIEDFCGNCFYWIDGFYSDSNRHMLISNENFNDTGSGYTDYGQGAVSDINGYILDIQGTTETGFVVKATAGSTTTHYCDYGILYASQLPCFGGSWSYADSAGAFRLGVGFSVSGARSDVGGRLIAL